MKFLYKLLKLLLKAYTSLIILLMFAAPCLYFVCIFLFSYEDCKYGKFNIINIMPYFLNFFIPYFFAATILHYAYKKTQCSIANENLSLKTAINQFLLYSLVIIVFIGTYYLISNI